MSKAKTKNQAAAAAAQEDQAQAEAETATETAAEAISIAVEAPAEQETAAGTSPTTYKVRVARNFLYFEGRFQPIGKVLTLSQQQYTNVADAVELIK